jgi:spore coat polysaccharide biosynthesis protein SpsF
MTLSVDATVQARTGSSRLPNKVLKPVLGKPLLQQQIERIQRAKTIDRVILATSDLPQDDPLEELANAMGIGCFRGSETDVISRVCGALEAFNIEVHAEFQGDNSIPDPAVIDSVVNFFLEHSNEYDYVTNALKTTFPPGLEVSVYPSGILFDANKRAATSEHREYVGFHINQHPEIYRIKNIEAPASICRPDLHLEVDTDEDFALVAHIYEHFAANPLFTIEDVVAYTDANPHLLEANSVVERRWKQYRQDS